MELTKTNTVLSLSKGYKHTEVGVIPEEWDLIRLGDFIKLKNGYAFSSEYFSNRGPIVMTPGNFKLEGGLKFEERNTIRFSGQITKEMCFSNGDLIMVMTDLTPDCNLLGKSGIVDSTEVLLHNQRIGKIIIKNSSVDKGFLNVFFNSWLYSNRMKSTATGSTVRHTSVPTINNTILALPTLTEQKAIATALSDVDALISSLDKLISKKKAIKQGAMQELLTPKEGWEIKTIKEVATYRRGSFPQPYGLSKWYDDIAGMPFVQVVDVGDNRKLKPETKQRISSEGAKMSVFVKKGSVILTIQGSIGRICITQYDAYVDRTLLIFESFLEEFNKFFFMTIVHQKFEIEKEKAPGGIIKTITKEALSSFEISYPSIEEQNRIAEILSDIDAEIEGLEEKKKKYQSIKQGMMQELLTGKTRLI